jgi:NitT/TauT family transport system substrate-binding protein
MTHIINCAGTCRRAAARLAVAALVLAICAAAFGAACAEAIKIGIIKQPNTGLIFLAQDRGYFTAEGLTAEFVYFDAGQPVAVAVASGAIDFGVTALTGGLYNLAGQGVLRIIAGQAREVPGYQDEGWFASGHAYASGLTTVKDIAGQTVALTQIGASSHYALGLAAEKYGFSLAAVRVLPLQSISNIVTALAGGRADFAPITMIPTLAPMLERGEIKVVAWVGDETPWQFGAAFTATATADGRRETVERFLRAYRKGARDFHDAFADASGKRADGPTTDAVLATISKYASQPVEQIKASIPYIDPDGRLDVKDVLHQITWYKAQGMLKEDVSGAAIIDSRYVIPLPER